ncbi:MAG: hypothetical protein OXU69_00300 [Gemmatimonadota bacterium]|nr:hypothetical protein [Gemmatimonadota bacterium]MDE2983119.1 hypothetical protein [Gemmatimonadota bacterium]
MRSIHEVLRLRDKLGRSLREIAAVVGISLSTVSTDPHRRAPDLKWSLPESWFELARHVGASGHVAPRHLDLELAPIQVGELAGHGLRLEQEHIALDPRMRDALEAALTRDAPGKSAFADAERLGTNRVAIAGRRR